MLGKATLSQATMASAHVFVTFSLLFFILAHSVHHLNSSWSISSAPRSSLNKSTASSMSTDSLSSCLLSITSGTICRRFVVCSPRAVKKRENCYGHIFDISDHPLCIRKKKLLLSPNIVPIIMPDCQSLFLHTSFWHLNNRKNDSCSWWKSPFHILHCHTLT